MGVVRWIVKGLVAMVFGAIFVAILSPGLAAFVDAEAQGGAYGILASFAVAALLIVLAPNVRRSFGRGFLLCGLAFLFLPLASLMLSGRVTSDMLELGVAAGATDAEQAGTMIGSGLAAGLTTLAAGFVGFVMGAIFIVAGLVLALGGRREVVVVEARAARRTDLPSTRSEPPFRR